ncbi:unnamed protein product [Gadus morhua 'NCC']
MNWHGRWSLKFAFLTAMHALLSSASSLLHAVDDVRSEPLQGNSIGATHDDRASAGQKRHGTTVPRLLIGRDWGPIGSLHFQGHPAALRLLIEVEGEQLLLTLQKNEGLFAGHYTETHYLADGSAVSSSHNSTTNCYYHGEVEGQANSDVSLSTCTGIRGLISLGEAAYVLEPSPDRYDGTHRVYRAEHLALPAGSCGHHLNLSSPTGAPPHHSPRPTEDSPVRDSGSRRKRDTQPTTKYVELIIVADNREFQKQGKDMDKVKQRLAEIANHVDKFYRALNIRVALVGLEVWSDADKCPVSQDPFTTLHEFLDWRKAKLLPQRPHDNAQLIR